MFFQFSDANTVLKSHVEFHGIFIFSFFPTRVRGNIHFFSLVESWNLRNSQNRRRKKKSFFFDAFDWLIEFGWFEGLAPPLLEETSNSENNVLLPFGLWSGALQPSSCVPQLLLRMWTFASHFPRCSVTFRLEFQREMPNRWIIPKRKSRWSWSCQW